MSDSFVVWALWFLAAFGASYVLAAAHISLPFRQWLAERKSLSASWLLLLLECCACTSWHFGWLGVYFGLVSGPRTLLHGAFVAFATSASSLLLARISGISKDAS